MGVEKVEVGYSGGKIKDPTYQQVSSRTTGHAEVVQVTFDPSLITYEEILKIFFTVHDPTTLNRQGGGCWSPIPLGDLFPQQYPARDSGESNERDRS